MWFKAGLEVEGLIEDWSVAIRLKEQPSNRGKEQLIVLIDTLARVHEERRKRASEREPESGAGRCEKKKRQIKTATYMERFSFVTSWKTTWHSDERDAVDLVDFPFSLTHPTPALRNPSRRRGGERGSRRDAGNGECRRSSPSNATQIWFVLETFSHEF